TIGLNGRVGPIGGIKQKMHGALRDGAEYFLAPGQNCPQVQGSIPSGLTVLRIDTLADAVTPSMGSARGTSLTCPPAKTANRRDHSRVERSPSMSPGTASED